MRLSAAACLLFVVATATTAARVQAATRPKKAPDSTPPTISHVSPGSCPRAGSSSSEPLPCQIEAAIVDDSGVFDPTLLYRLRGGAAFDRLPMRPVDGRADVYAAVVPASVAAAGDVEYLIEAFDVEGNGPARAGTEAGPLLLVKLVPDAVVVVPLPVPPPTVPEDDNTGLIIGVVAGVAAVAVAVVGIGVAVYALRPPANDVVVVNVEGPAPFTALFWSGSR